MQECVLCGKPLEKGGITEEIGGVQYVFDREECALLLRKFKSVYGNDFLTGW
jgi:hypothetical protein